MAPRPKVIKQYFLVGAEIGAWVKTGHRKLRFPKVTKNEIYGQQQTRMIAKKEITFQGRFQMV